jgi:DNA polymerase-3 subunit gamma/tau
MAAKKPSDTNSVEAAENTEPASKPYVVLARKYRPATFDDLIGQDVMVRTLRNAFASGRIAQAYMLTGVRGVGKTTTARILARALNYVVADGPHRPSLDMPVPGLHCDAIMESRHVDVVEMDAASHTGIDDIREILEGIRYQPAYARYRVFIIDEVHMLSKSAFNGLLKTLEEPPPHVKFIFATTEIRKVPATILSRCQRFDLKRVSEDHLAAHFAAIVSREGHQADTDALALIARAAEGSVRDGLSLLDQALALARGNLRAADVRQMLGLASREALFSLFEQVMRGDAKGALSALRTIYDGGGDPASVLSDLADITHALTRLKIAPGSHPADLTSADKARAERLAEALAIPRLSQAWQMLLKGIEEAGRAARPLAAAEMVLVRMCYIADLPTPLDLVRAGSGNGSVAAAHLASRADAHADVALPHSQAPSALLAPEPADIPSADPILSAPLASAAPEDEPPPPQRILATYADIAALAGDMRDLKLKVVLEEYTQLVQFAPGRIELHLLDGAPKNLAQELSRKLQHWTGERWVVALTDSPGAATLADDRRRAEEEALREVRKHPAVQSVFHYFPNAEIKQVRPLTDGEHQPTRGRRRTSNDG